MGKTGIMTRVSKPGKLEAERGDRLPLEPGPECSCFQHQACFPFRPGDPEEDGDGPHSYQLVAKPCSNLWTIVLLNAEDLWMETKNSISAKNLYRNIFSLHFSSSFKC